ncbi:MAG: CBS domain-containing protein [Candidatus Bathyarchaeota archaeon]|nr:CBS domain-containing protein [Candidatus Bathyarchaeota archaeon]
MSVIRVFDIMVRDPVTASPDASVVDVAKLMRDESIGSVIIVEDNKPTGIVTERDLVRRVIALGRDASSLKASDICSKPVLTVSEYESIDDAVDFMKEYNIRRLVVVNGEGEVSGIVTTDDIGYNLRRLSEEMALEYISMSRRIRTRP